MEGVWSKVCEQLGIDKVKADKWLAKIKEKYSGSDRHCQNLDMLEKKAEFLSDQPHRVVLAVFFQYFVYDAKSGGVELNCAAFKDFYDDAALDEVSLPSHFRPLLINFF